MLKILVPGSHRFQTPACGFIVSSSSSSSSSASPLRRSSPSCSSRKATIAPSIRRPDGDRCTLWSRSSSSSKGSSSTTSTMRTGFIEGGASGAATVLHDELELFLPMVPERMRGELIRHLEVRELIEVVMDLGRRPIARFPSGDWIMSEEPVSVEDLRQAISKVGDFSDDNRSGIDRSLHRISAIRNRKMQIIGLTCRVGRAISGSAEMIHDLVVGGGSILVIGPPGVGKTTLIREIARVLADKHMKRVVIVDTSNEIGGDGDVPHAGIGRARRMQVPNVSMQHNVMIEAVENHMPEVIIIDEIGTELEAMAASTIAQRGVQLVGTAHGVTIDSIIKNPCLQALVGGIESVTLGDDEARKRKVQKTILERKGPPTFTCAVEIMSKTECKVHHKLEATVDAILAGRPPLFEVRKMEASDLRSHIPVKLFEKYNKQESLIRHREPSTKINTSGVDSDNKERKNMSTSGRSPVRVYTYKSFSHFMKLQSLWASVEKLNHLGKLLPMHILFVHMSKDIKYDDTCFVRFQDKEKRVEEFVTLDLLFTNLESYLCLTTLPCYEILEADLLQVATVMGFEDDIDVTDDIGMANAILASSYEMKQNPWIRNVAKFHELPIFVIKENTMAQMVKAVKMIIGMDSFGSVLNNPSHSVGKDIEVEDSAPKRIPSLEELDALEEVRLAIEYIVIPGGEPVELLPRCSEIIARQMELVESYQLAAEKSGTELNSRLQILPMKLSNKGSSATNNAPQSSKQLDLNSLSHGNAGSSVSRLPLLPE